MISSFRFRKLFTMETEKKTEEVAKYTVEEIDAKVISPHMFMLIMLIYCNDFIV